MRCQKSKEQYRKHAEEDYLVGFTILKLAIVRHSFTMAAAEMQIDSFHPMNVGQNVLRKMFKAKIEQNKYVNQ